MQNSSNSANGALKSEDDDDVCEKYQKTVINLLVLQLKILGANQSSIDEALKPLSE